MVVQDVVDTEGVLGGNVDDGACFFSELLECVSAPVSKTTIITGVWLGSAHPGFE